MNKIRDILIEMVPFFIGFLILIFSWRNNLIVTVSFILMLLFLFLTRYEVKELKPFIFGLVAGGVIEIIGTNVGYQSFSNPDFFSIPLWLLLAWGFAFVVFARISNILKNGS